MIQQKTERERGMKNCGADLYKDYGYSKKLLGTVSGAGEVRLISFWLQVGIEYQAKTQINLRIHTVS